MTVEDMRKSGPDLSPAKRALLEKWKRGEAAQSAPVQQAILRRPQNEPAPLTFAQQRLWFLDQFVPDSPAYNIPGAIRIQGKLDLDALKRTLNEIVQRHAILRTTFSAVDGQPFQQISPDFNFLLHEVDLRSLAKEQRDDEAHRLSDLEAKSPFDLEKGPLFRASIIRQTDDDYVLILNMHHIISDGWSIDILLKEIAMLYQAFAVGRGTPLPELPIQYADFAYWQRQWLQGAELERQVSFWKRELANAPTVLEFPTDRPRSLIQTFRGATQVCAFSDELSTALKGLAQQEGVTLFMLLMAAFQVLLYRYSGQTDLLVGTPIANRTRIETEGLIGFFANTLVLRADLLGKPGFRELLQRVKEKTLNAYAHQDIPFEKLVEELHPERDMSRNPLFQVMFVLQNTPVSAIDMPALRFSLVEASSDTAKFDLWLSMTEVGNELHGTIEYSTDLFNASTIERLLGHFQTLLAGIVAHPEMQIADLPLMNASERHQLLVEWNDTATEYPYENCLHRLIEEQVKRAPDAIALIFDDQCLTYRELNQRANHLAHFLQSLGVRPETLVGLCAERSMEMVIGLLGILKAGGAYVPLDPGYPSERLAYMLEDSQVPLLLTQETLLSRLPPVVHSNSVVCLDRDWADIEKHSAENPVSPVSPANLAYMIYTSGSTGKPKGAMNTHRAICNRLLWMQDAYCLDETDRVLQKTPFSFDVSVWEFFWPLMTGARLVLAKPEGHKDAAYLVSLIVEEQITTLHFVPSMFGVFLEEPELETCRSIRRVICSGEALPYEFQERFFSRMKAELHNLYGPTEAAVDVTYWACQPEMTRRSIPIGRPIANTQIYILDPNGQPTPIGVPGELHIGGVGVGRGYRNRPELTAEKFVPNPFIDCGQWTMDGADDHSLRSTVSRLYRTGDLARYLPDGNIEFLGRIDFQVKLRGFRIELGEIEAALRQHPALDDAAVVVKEVERQTESQETFLPDKQLVAYIVPRRVTGETSDGFSSEQVTQWQTVFNDTYAASSSQTAPDFNIIGWNSSYTGEPLPADEMREWVDQTVERILVQKPGRVLEIGCGTGLLLFRVAPHCQAYWGTDISETALVALQKQVASSGSGLPQVTLLHRSADRLDGIPEHSFDMVVLNSVIQYFPSIDYLVSVLEGAVRLLRPGGHIFIGDVRSLPLLEAFHTSVEFAKAPATLATRLLRLRVQKRLAQEQELAIDPAFFSALKSHIPMIRHAEVQLKRGKAVNELTRFRYDVTLDLAQKRNPSPPIMWLDWDEEGWTFEKLRQRLTEGEFDLLAIKGIPNSRLATEQGLLRLLKGPQPPMDVAGLREMLQQNPVNAMLNPEALWALGNELSYQVKVGYSDLGESYSYSVIFQRRTAAEGMAVLEAATSFGESSPRPWGSYANHPLREKLARQLTPELRAHLKENLPEYMIPANFVLLDELPLSPSGKLDRQALPPPPPVLSDMESDFITPRTPVEVTLARIWAQVLGLEQVGVHDNFFGLGGDSIRSIQIVSRAKREGLQLTPKQMFQHQTIAELALVVVVSADTLGTKQAQVFPGWLLNEQERQQLEPLLSDENIEDIYPLTPLQEVMLAYVLRAPEPGLYFLSQTSNFTGDVNIPFFEQAWQQVIMRHQNLRASFLWEGLERPLQVIHKHVNAHIEQYDWRGMNPKKLKEQMLNYFRTAQAQRFDLRQAPQTRLALFRIGEKEYIFFWAFNYMLQDGWSYPLITGEVFEHYRILTQKDARGLEPNYLFSEYMGWLARQDMLTAETHWRKLFDGFSQPTSLVSRMGIKTPGHKPYQFRKANANQECFNLSPSTVAALHTLTRKHQLTLNTLLQAAWALLLKDYTKNEDVVFGVVVSGRPAELIDIEKRVGQFGNFLPFRVNVSVDKPLLPWLKEIQAQQVEMRQYEYTSLAQIQRWANVPEDVLLFQSYLVFENFPWDIASWSQQGQVLFGASLQASAIPIDLLGTQTQYPLRIEVWPEPNMDIYFLYDKNYFEEKTITNMMKDLQILLESMAESPILHHVGDLQMALRKKRKSWWKG